MNVRSKFFFLERIDTFRIISEFLIIKLEKIFKKVAIGLLSDDREFATLATEELNIVFAEKTIPENTSISSILNALCMWFQHKM